MFTVTTMTDMKTMDNQNAPTQQLEVGVKDPCGKLLGICIQPNPRAAAGRREIRLQKISKSARFSTDPHCKIVQISSTWPGRNPPPPPYPTPLWQQ
jgi:hypothetical protein